jgi:uncharacterized membrane protein HdeD (DUF308 family)
MDNNEVKPWYASKAVIGGAVAVVAGVVGLFGYSVNPEDSAAVTEALVGLGAVVGGLLAVVGRIKASKKIK